MAEVDKKPPAVLGGEVVLEYAVLDERVAFGGHSYLFVDGKELGPVPCLAIAQSADGEALLLHCDRNWAVLGMAGYGSVDQAKRRAERIYRGVSACWVQAHSMPPASQREDDWAGLRCSFCGKSPDQVRQMIEGRHADEGRTARICDSCISECHRLLSSK